MSEITIDDVTYALDELPDEAKAQLHSLQETEKRIVDVQQELAILQTARNAYATALKTILES